MSCKSFLTPINFKLQIRKLPTFEAYVQKVEFPGIQTGQTQGLKNPFQTLNVPGEHMTFDELKATFKLDEDMDNYLEIFEWIQGIGKPTDFAQYAALAGTEIGSGQGVQVDGNLILLNSTNQPNVKFNFIDLYPVNLSGFELDYTVENVPYLTSVVTFSYRQYTYERLI